MDVLNRGYSGYNSRWALTVLDDAVVQLKPDLVVLFFGKCKKLQIM
jgi:lysophospholipase L1-like esterase